MSAGRVSDARSRYLTTACVELCEALVFMLGWNADGVPVYVDGGPRPVFKARTGAELWQRAHRLDLEQSAEVAIGLPRKAAGVVESTVLWAWVRSPDSLARAQGFRPAPSVVLRFGASSERLLVWSLEEAVPWALVVPGVERLVYRLRAPRNRSEPEMLRVPVPGTFLRRGRTRPAPVLVTRLDTSSFSRERLVGRLREPPAKDAWRQRSTA